ncbi:putative protein kinase C conserved region 2 (CalB) [Lyophyllum shimeji]|uniref:Uncharacterized protein n=1 Tax=Lyophyllum shimeji TaxID=47721 RepID=A0A9P3UIC3_LYOSH|nr:putative protein kinase C conserved region 2 (CalB) [Lyophyllum shimeji]
MSGRNRSEPAESNANEREVTDPVTHLPVVIHDHSSGELEQIPAHPSVFQDVYSQGRHGEDAVAASHRQHLELERILNEEIHRVRWLEASDVESRTKIRTAVIATCAAAIGGSGGLIFLWVWSKLLGRKVFGSVELLFGTSGSLLVALGVGACVLFYPSTPLESTKVARRKTPREGEKGVKDYDDEGPESDFWLNALLHSLWPIANPALFTPIADMLEDALQSTLPSFVHGVRVADIGQGSEPVRILGIRWLAAGKAGEETEGMKAEEGDFINLEVAFAYRARTDLGSGLRNRSGNAHLLMEFFLRGGVPVPVWVELTGLLSTARMRIQLTPNPPFFSFMTMTLLGQPKITLICTPLSRNFPNVMDVPGLSQWLQTAIDKGVSKYVAPRSLNLNLKELLKGREKMDTETVGLVLVTIRSAKGFRQGDVSNILARREGRKGDLYATLGWGKWGKPLWSTRIISNEDCPVWDETTALLAGPTEVHAQERLRVQLWDFDRMKADDLLGTVEISLEDLMHQSENRFSARKDIFTKTSGSPEQGRLSWECGFFSKTTLEQHLEERWAELPEFEREVATRAERKYKKAKARENVSGEIEQQKEEEMREMTQELIAQSKPREEWPTGVLAVKIERIFGLEVQKVKGSGFRDGSEGEDEESEDLPSPYCTVIINHHRVYKTRTKMKTDKPYFNALAERWLRHWRTTVVIISVRDARMHEPDPLIGVIVLPLHRVFEQKSHVNATFSLVGGIGHGRMRLALTFRSVQAKLPTRLLGWVVGTLEVDPAVSPSFDLPADLASCTLVFRTVHGKGKMPPHRDGGWRERQERPLRLPVKKRYQSCLLIEFHKHALGIDRKPAFATLWLKDIPDNRDITTALAVRKSDDRALERARANTSYEIGERVGQITVKFRFWPGLSVYHRGIAEHDADVAEVMEVLDRAEEAKEIGQATLPSDEAGHAYQE